MSDLNLRSSKDSSSEKEEDHSLPFQSLPSLAQIGASSRRWTLRELFLLEAGIDLGPLKPVEVSVLDQVDAPDKKECLHIPGHSFPILEIKWDGLGMKPTSRLWTSDEYRKIKMQISN